MGSSGPHIPIPTFLGQCPPLGFDVVSIEVSGLKSLKMEEKKIAILLVHCSDS